MSFSWVDPHFAALYARREEERLAERLAVRMRALAACEPDPSDLSAGLWREPGAFENEQLLRGGHIRLLR